MTLVSVVIPTKNRVMLLKDAIESVLAVQRQDFDLEVIVVDDGSTDDTVTLVARYPVTYLRNEQSIGLPGARNKGFAAARGDFVTFLDDDDVWLPTNVTPQLKAFAANPAFGAVHGQIIMTGSDRTPWGSPMPEGPLTGGWIFHELLGYWTQVGCLVIRRSVLQEVGAFDVTLQSDGEDWDLILRIARRYPIGRVEEPSILFRQHGERDEMHWRRSMHDTMKVFHRHTRQESLPRRLALQRHLWRHRGWYAAKFVGHARAYADRCEYERAWRSMRYALRASPPHALVKQPAFWSALGKCATGHVRPSARS